MADVTGDCQFLVLSYYRALLFLVPLLLFFCFVSRVFLLLFCFSHFRSIIEST
jgi:hypothetical protein